MKRPRIIVIEDDLDWLDKICKILNKHLLADIEQYKLFNKAEERIWEQVGDIDLLITDIFPSNHSREKTGENLAKYVGHANIPVIIVTGDSEYPLTAWKELKEPRIIHKPTFNKVVFMNMVNSLLISKPPRSFDQDTKSPPNGFPNEDNFIG